jgi:YfiH family protein
VYRRNGVYRSELLDGVSWVEHGFATKESSHWPGEYIGVKQIHSNIAVVAGDGVAEGDALVTSDRGRYIGVRTADCVPLLLADRQRPAVAAVHAGWRGSAANIVAAAIDRLRREFGSDAGDLVVAVGPSIGRCCYEVGPEVAGLFGVSTSHLDLVEVNRRQLTQAGVNSANIDICGLCTSCTPDEFHSWRRDRERFGRMVAAIGIR